MQVTDVSAGADARGDRPLESTAAAPRAVSAAETAWIAVGPCALVTIAAILLLGPPLGHLLFTPGDDRLWPPGWWETTGHAEPTKQARYLIAAIAPALLLVAVLVGPRRIALRPWIARTSVVAGQAVLVALLAVALIDQRPLAVMGFTLPPVFGLGTLAPAAVLLLAAALVLRRPELRRRLVVLGRETRRRRWTATALVVGLISIWMLEAPLTDALAENTIGLSGTWTLNDAMAVLGGRTPLVDFHPIYAKLLPYPTAVVLSTFGTTTFVYTTFMAILAGLALLAVYAVFRALAHSSLLGLALFVPFVAVTDVKADAGYRALSMPPMWPMRYGGAFLLAWLAVRHLSARRPRQASVVFFAAGLLALNSPEFGTASLLATAAALLVARPPRSARAAGRLAVSAAGGVLAAVALVSLFTFLRAGALPAPDLLLEWSRIFTTLGWFSLPLRAWDLHLAIYATFVAAIAVAGVRLARRDEDAPLTGMLMWSGVFGLIVGGYYVGRPDVIKLTSLFAPWSFALSMLAIVALTGVTRPSWRPTLPRLLVLFGVAVTICTLTDVPQPLHELSRLRRGGSEPHYLPQAERFVGEHAQVTEKVVILLPMSYRISHDLRLENVAPYGFMNAIVTHGQLQTLLDTLREQRVKAVFVPEPGSLLAHEGDSAPEQLQELVDAGYDPAATEHGMVAFRSR